MTEPESTRRITLSHSLYAVIDAEDFKRLSRYRWYAITKSSGITYAQRAMRIPGTKKQTSVGMHRDIVGLEAGDKRVVDHINDGGLDNRRSNLRVCTVAQNVRKKRKSVNRDGTAPTSQYKGVSYYPITSRWTAKITLDGKERHLGYFQDEKEAARAYNRAALARDSVFVRLNDV